MQKGKYQSPHKKDQASLYSIPSLERDCTTVLGLFSHGDQLDRNGDIRHHHLFSTDSHLHAAAPACGPKLQMAKRERKTVPSIFTLSA